MVVDVIRVAFGLHFGVVRYQLHISALWIQVNGSLGHTWTLLPQELGSFFRHASISAVIKRALDTLKIPSYLEQGVSHNQMAEGQIE